MSDAVLERWRDGATKRAILEFIESVTEPGDGFVPIQERIAVFDNDGTLWCEKPMPIQLDFILRRFVAMAQAQPELQERQPWKAAYERDDAWFGRLLAEHYAGDDTNVRTLAGGLLAAYEGISVEEFEAQSDTFLRTVHHPTLGRAYLECAYAPMVELLGYLEANGFSNYIASGGGRDFMRPISLEMYGIPRERVIGSASGLEYTSDEGAARSPTRPSSTTSTTGRRSRSGSGAVRGAGRSSRRATRTATLPCSTSPSTRQGRRCACSSSTTTPSASSTTRAARSRPSSGQVRGAGAS